MLDGLVRITRFVCIWSRIKPLGELSLLTRASYAFLLFVPILAGVWPLLTRYAFKDALLPLSWVLAFFAALLAMIGQTTYQMFAPQVVKVLSRSDYIAAEIKRYYENPTPYDLQWAEKILRELGEFHDVTSGGGVQRARDGRILPESEMIRYEAEIVGKASSVLYDRKDRGFTFAAFISLVSYFISLCLIVRILIGQVYSVLSAAGIVPK